MDTTDQIAPTRHEVRRIERQSAELRIKAAKCPPGLRSRLFIYLELVNETCDEVDRQLDEIDPDCTVDAAVVRHGVQKARDRLAIAETAVAEGQ